jgi:hypothetical protein
VCHRFERTTGNRTCQQECFQGVGVSPTSGVAVRGCNLRAFALMEPHARPKADPISRRRVPANRDELNSAVASSRPMLRRPDPSSCPHNMGRPWAMISESSAVSISRYGADNLGIGGEPAERLLGAGYAVVDADLKDATTRPAQCHLGVWSDLADQVRRLTGARFIVSLTAVLDFNAHPSIHCLWERSATTKPSVRLFWQQVQGVAHRISEHEPQFEEA